MKVCECVRPKHPEDSVVLAGRIGNLLVQIPLTSLKSKHVVVELDRVMVVVGPRNARDWDADQEQELEERIKQSKLARWEKECAHKES